MEAQIFVHGHRVDDRRGQLPVRAGAEPYGTRPLTAITQVVIHYSGVDRDDSAQAMALYQTTKQGGDLFPALAYHFVVHQNGEIEQCHHLATHTWHAGEPANTTGIAVCLPMLNGPSEAQLAATTTLRGALEVRLGRQLAVKGHSDFMATACPGPGWRQWRERLLGPPAPGGAREGLVGGVPVRWAFWDWYRRLEDLRPGLCGAPEGPHRLLGGGDAVQEFASCTLLWSEQRMWISWQQFPGA